MTALGDRAANWTGDEVSYQALHLRIVVRRGKASSNLCAAGCGKRAQDWAYDHSDPSPRVTTEGLEYSTDVSRYIPLCKACHRTFDQDARGKGQCGSVGGYYRHRRRGEVTCQDCRDALAAYERAKNALKPRRPRVRATKCKRGHSLDDAYVTSDGRRQCRPCRIERKRRYRQERRLRQEAS